MSYVPCLVKVVNVLAMQQVKQGTETARLRRFTDHFADHFAANLLCREIVLKMVDFTTPDLFSVKIVLD